MLLLFPTSGEGRVQSMPHRGSENPDSLRIQSLQDRAEEAAGHPSVIGNFLVPFLGGVPTGFFTPVFALGSPFGFVVGGLGTAFIGGITYGSYHQDALPDEALFQDLQAGGSRDVEIFSGAYSAHLRRRRVTASLLGGGLGVGVGIGALVWAFSKADF
jgi:hypothetical protein